MSTEKDLTSAGAILGELNALRRLYTTTCEQLKVMRARVRDEEFFHAREGAETVDAIRGAMERAYEKHLTGDNEGALKTIEEIG